MACSVSAGNGKNKGGQIQSQEEKYLSKELLQRILKVKKHAANKLLTQILNRHFKIPSRWAKFNNQMPKI
jgi:hypothetical protein